MGEPTFQDVAYGDHERDVVDLYQADSKDPAPVYVYIHGGGFRGGDKASISQVLLWRRSIIRFRERTGIRRRWSTASGQFSLSAGRQESGIWTLPGWRLEVECVVRMREDVLEEDQGAIQARFYRETVEFLKRQFGLG